MSLFVTHQYQCYTFNGPSPPPRFEAPKGEGDNRAGCSDPCIPTLVIGLQVTTVYMNIAKSDLPLQRQQLPEQGSNFILIRKTTQSDLALCCLTSSEGLADDCMCMTSLQVSSKPKMSAPVQCLMSSPSAMCVYTAPIINAIRSMLATVLSLPVSDKCKI